MSPDVIIDNQFQDVEHFCVDQLQLSVHVLYLKPLPKSIDGSLYVITLYRPLRKDFSDAKRETNQEEENDHQEMHLEPVL